MKNYASLRKQHNGSLAALTVLALCVLLSGTMLFSRLVNYTPAVKTQYIPLTVTSGITKVQTGYRDTNGNVQLRQPGDTVTMSAVPMAPTMAQASGGFADENTVWVGETQVEIFRLSYDNERGETTVSSQNGDKLLAPGTSNTYQFELRNTGDFALDYTMTMEAFFSSETHHTIPVSVTLKDYQNTYLVGSADGGEDVLKLNEVHASGSVSAGNRYPYTLTWEWPFEGNDVYDTLLGNLAEDEDITLTIRIHTIAEGGSEGGIPDTGDNSQIMLPVMVMLVSLAGILLLLLLPRRKKQEGEGHE